jgi:hypothetical protein
MSPENLQLNPHVKVPFPERLKRNKDEKQYAKLLEGLKKVQKTFPILDAVMHIPMYAKIFKELLSKKKTIEGPEIVTLSKECNAIIQNPMSAKLDDPGSFCVPSKIGSISFIALCDLGSSISVLPSIVSKELQVGDLQSNLITLQLPHRSLRKPA